MNNTANAKHEYREAAVRGATQIELVIMMYDMIIQDLDRAMDAIGKRDTERRSSETKHAFSVLEQLQGTLNFVDGGDAAVIMDRLYSIARAKILEGCIKNSPEILHQQISIFSDLRDAWRQAESVNRPSESLNTTEAPIPVMSSETESVAGSWSA
jgi:flagellar secretion chaperone FliS